MCFIQTRDSRTKIDLSEEVCKNYVLHFRHRISRYIYFYNRTVLIYLYIFPYAKSSKFSRQKLILSNFDCIYKLFLIYSTKLITNISTIKKLNDK